MRIKWHRLLMLLVVAMLAVAAAGCGGDDDEAGGTGAPTGEATGEAGGTLVFAGAADPVALDGAVVSDGESLRVITQIFETLVALKPGTTEPEPGLAESWSADDTGKVWTFKIREGVKFHDGTDLDAEAVCFNFDRWYNFKGPLQNPGATYYWQVVFGGFKTYNKDSGAPKDSLYASCEATDSHTAVLTLTKPSATFIPALSQQAFSIASPKALKEYKADEGTTDADGVFTPTGTFGTEHPIGTGPLKFDSWTRNDKLTLVKNDDYWGDKSTLDTLIIRPIADNAARLQALQTGEIQGYDLVEPQDIATIEGDSKLQIIDRPAFNVAYVGFNHREEADRRHQGARGDRVRPRPPGGRGQLLLRPRRAGEGVHAAGGRRLRGRRSGVHLRPGEGEADPEGRRLHAPGAARVLVPDGRVASVHAGPEAELRGVRREPEQVGLQGDAEECPVEPGLPGPRGRRQRRQPAHARLDRRLRRRGQLHRHVLPEPAEGLGDDDEAADQDREAPERRRDRDGRGEARRRCTRTRTGRS